MLFARVSATFQIAVVRLDVINYEQVLRLNVKVHDAFGVNLVQAEQDVARDHLDVSQVERLAPIDEVFEEIGRSRWQFEFFFPLNLLQHPVVQVGLRPVGLDFGHELGTDVTSWLLGDEEKHILRLVHEFDLCQVLGVLDVRHGNSLAQDILFLLLAELGGLHRGERVDFGEVAHLAL